MAAESTGFAPADQQRRRSIVRSPYIRILAFLLAVVMISVTVLAGASRISFSSEDYEDSPASGAAAYLSENTEYLSEDRTTRVERLLKNAFSASKDFETAYTTMSICIAREKYPEAIAECRKCIGFCGSNGDLLHEMWMKLGCLMALDTDYDGAIDSLSRAIGHDTSCSTCFLLRAQMYMEKDDAAAALSDLEQYAVLEGDTDSSLLLVAAQLYEYVGNYAGALSRYLAILDIEGNAADLQRYADCARCAILSEDMDTAYRMGMYYLNGGGADTDGNVQYIVAMCLMTSGQYADAADRFLGSIASGYAEPAELYLNSTLCRYSAGEYEEAIRTAEQGMEATGDSASYRQWIGMSQMAIAAYDEAIAAFEAALGMDGTLGEVSFYLGLCHLILEEYQDAVPCFTAAIDAGAELYTSYYDRGLCYVKLGKWQAAYDDMQTVLNSNADAEMIKNALAIVSELEPLLHAADTMQ